MSSPRSAGDVVPPFDCRSSPLKRSVERSPSQHTLTPTHLTPTFPSPAHPTPRETGRPSAKPSKATLRRVRPTAPRSIMRSRFSRGSQSAVRPLMEVSCQTRVTVVSRLTVTGPRCQASSPALLIWPEPLVVDDKPFILFSPGCEWLCRFLTGQRAGERPLSRQTIFEVVREALQGGERAEEPTQPSEELGLGSTTRQGGKRRRGVGAKVVRVTLPKGPGSAETVTLQGFTKRGRSYLELSGPVLAWMYEWCDSEVKRPKRPSARNELDASSVCPRVFFSRSECCWICRGPLGSKKFKVARTTASGCPLDASAFRRLMQEQKEAAEREMQEQQRRAIAGVGPAAGRGESQEERHNSSQELQDSGDVVPTDSSTADGSVGPFLAVEDSNGSADSVSDPFSDSV